MAHARNANADALLDKEYTVLDKGFVRLVDYMGGDDSIVQAARVSYGEGTKKLHEDRGLIRYLMRHHHTTPFEMVEMKFHVKLPIFVARQWIRHRTANVNEYSGRYSVMREDFYVPNPEDVQAQSRDNKQGRRGVLPEDITDRFIRHLEENQRESYQNYTASIDAGIARELARIDLPLSLYTEWYWKIDLHNLFHFLGLRLDKHAQMEIREYAKVMADMTKVVAPLAYEAFEDYALNAHQFSGPELAILQQQGILTIDPATMSVDTLVAGGLSTREAIELVDKLTKIGEKNP